VTWVRKIIGSHPQVVDIRYETRLIEVLARRWYMGLQTGSESDYGLRRALSPQEINECFRSFLLSVFRKIARRDGRFVEKTPFGAPYLHAVREIFPRAQIVYLIRHPIAVIESMITQDVAEWNFGHGVRGVLEMWLAEIGAHLSSPARGEPYVIEVRYENLAGDPAGAFRGLFERLGLDPGAVAPARFERQPPQVQPFVLSEPEREYVLVRARRDLAELGYDDAADWARVPAERAELCALYSERRLTDRELRCPELLIERALRRAAQIGHGRVLIYGAGQHTWRFAEAFRTGAARIIGVADDAPEKVGQRIGEWTVMPAEDCALHLDVDAVVPSSDAFEDTLIARCDRFQRRGIEVVPIYGSRLPCPAQA
jgi:hypothetical protein